MTHYFVLCLSVLLYLPSYKGSSASVGNRIIGGDIGYPDERDVIASVRFSNLQGTFHICGGFIINKHWVGTAAQCLTGQTIQNTVVAVGTTTITGGTIYTVNQFEIHKNYNELTLAHDIALLRTTTPIIFGVTIAKAVLKPEVIPDKKLTYIYGWGRTSANSGLSEGIRRELTTTMTNDECRAKFPYVAKRFIFDDRHMCSAASTVATCPGDAGGPVLLSTNGYPVIGIVSWVEPCVAGQTSVNTRISFYINWISNITSADD